MSYIHPVSIGRHSLEESQLSLVWVTPKFHALKHMLLTATRTVLQCTVQLLRQFVLRPTIKFVARHEIVGLLSWSSPVLTFVCILCPFQWLIGLLCALFSWTSRPLIRLLYRHVCACWNQFLLGSSRHFSLHSQLGNRQCLQLIVSST